MMKPQAVYGVIFSEDRSQVLLVKRRDLPVWVLPGGGLEQGEDPHKGAQREVEEETGCQVALIRHVAIYLPVNRMTQCTYLFEYHIIRGSPHPTIETKDAQFFPVASLPLRLAPPFAKWIQDAYDPNISTVTKNTEGVTYRVLIQLLLQHPILIIRYLLTKLGIRYNDTT